MEYLLLEERYVLEYIKDILNDYKMASIEVENAKYHHNTEYHLAPSIIEHGILSLIELNNLEIRNDSKEFLARMSDTESHINGNDGISLSIAGLQDLYPDEEEYDPYDISQIDFLITNDIRTYRVTHNYGNEFIVYNRIKPENLKSVDIRLLKYIDSLDKNTRYLNEDSIEKIIKKYNSLRKIALSLKNSNLDIPLRELSSNENITLDIDKLANNKKIVLKKEQRINDLRQVM